MEDLGVIENQGYQLKLHGNKQFTFNLPSLVQDINTSTGRNLTELNVLLVSKLIDTDPSQVLFNQVLDGLIQNLTNKQSSLFVK